MKTKRFTPESHRSSAPAPITKMIGVCYRCRCTVWDGQAPTWQAPPICPHCQQALVLSLLEITDSQHARRQEAHRQKQ